MNSLFTLISGLARVDVYTEGFLVLPLPHDIDWHDDD